MTKNFMATFLLVAALVGAPHVAFAQLTIQSEEAAHPRLVKALHEMQAALAELTTAQSTFGGNKARAISDLRGAIHSTKKALYYRLNMDDGALDRIP